VLSGSQDQEVCAFLIDELRLFQRHGMRGAENLLRQLLLALLDFPG
jgi:hypothetical protein